MSDTTRRCFDSRPADKFQFDGLHFSAPKPADMPCSCQFVTLPLRTAALNSRMTALDWLMGRLMVRTVIFAEEDGAIVGIAQVKPYRDCREFGSLVVLPSQCA